MSKIRTCPLCNTNFEEHFCPHCGLAWSKFDSAYSAISEFQFCFECNTANPQDAKYCRNCGTELTFHAKDKNKHEWVDLGLSVLWSAENMQGYYPWMDSKKTLNPKSQSLDLDFINDGKDIATAKWGNKWRTPSKEEFEELIEKCQWEKIIMPTLRKNELKNALKAIGPNGNHIILPVTGYAGCLRRNSFDEEVYYNNCSYWTSTKDEDYKNFAFYFYYTGYKSPNFNPALHAKIDIERALQSNKLFGNPISNERRAELEERVKILDSEISSHQNYRNTFDETKRNYYWLNTPLNKESIRLDSTFIIQGYTIRPVLDKK